MILRGTLSTIQDAVVKAGIDKNALILIGRSLVDPNFGESYLYSASRERDSEKRDSIGSLSTGAD